MAMRCRRHHLEAIMRSYKCWSKKVRTLMLKVDIMAKHLQAASREGYEEVVRCSCWSNMEQIMLLNDKRLQK